jgi:ribonuclease E
MAKRMLIDATHPEETRVVVLNGNRLEEFDFETSTKKQVKGNIYLAKVTRVEPSLQAAFVEYGGNRHGFLAFSEIHADYYRIPVADRRGMGADPQPPEGVRSETAAEADENGVPLEDALPEPVTVVETDPSREETAEDEGSSGEGLSGLEGATSDQETSLRAGETRGESRAAFPWEENTSPAARDVSEARASPASATSAETASPADELRQQPELPSATDAALVETPSTPRRAWIATSAADEIVVAPEGPAIESSPPDRDAVVPVEEIPAPPAAEIIEAHGPIELHESELSRPHNPADDEHGDGDAVHRPVAGDAGTANGERFEVLASADDENGASNVVEVHALAASENGESDFREVRDAVDSENGDNEVIETLGGDEFEEVETQRSRAHRHYKIQEVIKRRQIMLVQVTKEERGNKGAALTTYLSLAGRYCVLMPNTARGGGVSRKITSLGDRRRLKEILEELDIPEGMGVIVRTAGAERSKAEIKRDYEYLLRLWNEIRELTLRSTAPALIYEEGDLIKRSIRDLYTRDIDEVLVEGEEGYRTAKAFMKMLMPSHAKRVQPYRDPQIGLLHRFQVESQIDAIHSPVVQLRSGGYVVIDQAEALVAIDVNSGRATRERNIEETALRTNLEAAEEIARQLRLRDLAGLIVIDFIDMEEHRNQAAVERRLKEALRNDRARIQVGRISPFGLLEMSRQRLRSSLTEASTQPCPHCGGTGFIRSTESTALYVLRSIEEEGMRRRSAEVCIYVPTTVALYILNHKRDSLAQLETRYAIHVLVARDDTLIPPAFRLDRLRAIEPGETAAAVASPLTQTPDIEEDEVDDDLDEVVEAEAAEQPGDGEDERVRARRRRRRRRRHEDERSPASVAGDDEDAEEPASARVTVAAIPEVDSGQDGDEDSEAARLRRRRGRRGGRRRGRREEGVGPGSEIGRAAADGIEIVPVNPETPEDNDFEFDERDAAVVASEAFWSQAGVPQPSTSEIEAASLPALAGERASAELPPTVVENAIGIEAASPLSVASEGTSAEPPQSFTALAATEIEAESLPVVIDDDLPVEWPPTLMSAASDIEAASLPALAGEGAPGQPFSVAAGLAEQPSEAAAPDHEPVPQSWPGTKTHGNGETQPIEAANTGAGAGEPGAARLSNGQNPSAADAAAGGEPADETPASSESQPAPAPEGEPAQIVQDVTKKPENPRRGWWQRLIQS